MTKTIRIYGINDINRINNKSLCYVSYTDESIVVKLYWTTVGTIDNDATFSHTVNYNYNSVREIRNNIADYISKYYQDRV